MRWSALMLIVGATSVLAEYSDPNIRLTDLQEDQYKDLLASEQLQLSRKIAQNFEAQKSAYQSIKRNLLKLRETKPNSRRNRRSIRSAGSALQNNDYRALNSVDTRPVFPVFPANFSKLLESREGLLEFALMLKKNPELIWHTHPPPLQTTSSTTVRSTTSKLLTSSVPTIADRLNEKHLTASIKSKDGESTSAEPLVSTISSAGKNLDKNLTVSTNVKFVKRDLNLHRFTPPNSDASSVLTARNLDIFPSEFLHTLTSNEKTETVLETLETRLYDHKEVKHLLRHASTEGPNLQPLPDSWHSYSYNTGVYDRERLTISSITTSPGNILTSTSKIFQIQIGNFLLATDSQGMMVLLDLEGAAHKLQLGDGWESHDKECSCDQADIDERCACCRREACRCSSSSICRVCPRQQPFLASSCPGIEARIPAEEAVIIQQNSEESYFVASHFDSVAIYRTDGHAISLLHPKIDFHVRAQAGSAVTSVGVLELHVMRAGVVVVQQYLITFRASFTAHSGQQILLGEDKKSYQLWGLIYWEAIGNEVKFLQMDGRALFFVSDGTTVTALELKEDKNDKYPGMDAHVENLGTFSTGTKFDSWHCFLNLGEAFIALSDPEKCVLFKVVENKIVEAQLISAAELNIGNQLIASIIPIPSGNYRGDTALLMTTSGGTMLWFTWHPLAYMYKAGNSRYTSNIAHWNSIGIIQTNDVTKVLGTANDGSVHVVNMKLSLEELRDPALLQYDKAKHAMQQLQARLASQHEVLRSALARLRRSVEKSSIVEGNIIIRGSVEADRATAAALDLGVVTVTTSSGRHAALELHESRMRDYEAALDHERQRILEVETKLNGGVQKHLPGASVAGHLTFANLSANFLETENYSAGTTFLEDIVCDLVNAKNPSLILGTKVITSPTRVDSLRIASLDGVPIQDLITKDMDCHLINVTYRNGLSILDNFQVGPGIKVAGVDLNVLRLVSEDQHFNSCSFEVLQSSGRVTSDNGEMNGIVLPALSRSIVTNSNDDLVFLGSLQLLQEVDVHGDASAPFVMNVNISNLFANAVRKSSNTWLKSDLIFEFPVEVSGNLNVNGPINGHSFPVQFPYKRNPYGFFEHKSFEDLKIRKLIVKGTVDSVRSEEVVTLSTNQVIGGEKVFNSGIEVEGNLNVDSYLVDGVDLRRVGEEAGRSRGEEITYNVIFTSPVRLNNLQHQGRLNSFNFSEVVSDLLLRSDVNFPIQGKKTFEKGVSTDQLSLMALNFIPVEAFIRTGQPITISGLKTFTRGLFSNKLEVDGLIDGINLSNIFNGSLYKNLPGQRVCGRKVFTNFINGSQLIVHETINEIDFNNVATKTSDNDFKMEQSFFHVNFESLDVKQVFLATQIINGIDISQLSNRFLYLDTDQNVSGSIICTGNLTFESSLAVEYVNDIHFGDFVQNLVLGTDSDWTQTNLEIEQLDVRGDVLTKGSQGLSNVNISALDKEAIKLDSEFVDTNAFWESLSFLSEVHFDGLVNERRLAELKDDSVFIPVNGELIITGTKTFLGNVSVTGNVSASSVNEMHLPTKAFTKNTDQLVSGSFEFTSMNVKDITFAGLFNGINVADLLETRLVANVELAGPIIFTGNVSIDHLVVDGYVEDLDIVGLLDDLVRVNDTSVDFTAEKSFSIPPRFSSLYIDDVNGENYEHLVEDLVSLREDNHFAAPFLISKVMTDAVMAETVTVKGFVDGENAGDLVNDLIYLNRREIVPGTPNYDTLQIGSEASPSELLVGTLNFFNVTELFLLTDTPQTFKSDIQFQKIWAENIFVNGFVNGWKMDAFRRALKVTGGQTIHSNMQLLSGDVLNSLNLTGLSGTTASLNLAEDIIHLDINSPKFISGALNFSQPLEVKSLWCSTNLVNDVDIKKLAENAWYRDRDTVITGNYTFLGPAFFENEFIFGHHYLSMLPAMTRRLQDLKQRAELPLRTLRESFVSESAKSSSLVDILDQSFPRPVQLRAASSMSLPSSAVAPLIVQSLDAVYLLEPQVEGSCDVSVLRWSGSTFQPWLTLAHVGRVAGYVNILEFNSTFVAAAVRESYSPCPNASSFILKISGESLEISQRLPGFDSASGFVRLPSRGVRLGTYSYSLLSTHGGLSFREVPPSNIDQKTWMSGHGETSAWVWLSDDALHVSLNQTFLHRLRADQVLDVAMVNTRDEVVVAFVEASEFAYEKSYNLRVVRGLRSRSGLEIQDILPLTRPSNVSLVTVAGTFNELNLIVTTDAETSPRLFWLKGSGRLSAWEVAEFELTELRNVSWSSHFHSNGSTFITFLSSGDSLTVHEIVLDGGPRLQERTRVHRPSANGRKTTLGRISVDG